MQLFFSYYLKRKSKIIVIKVYIKLSVLNLSVFQIFNICFFIFRNVC